MSETWKIIPETNNMYEASDMGNIRSVDRDVKHKTSGHITLKGKLLKFTEGNNGYYYVTICGESKRKCNVHVLVCYAFYGKRPDGYHVDHKDRNRKNNVLSNLSYKTVFDNCSFRGSNHGNALLTEIQVKEIKERYKKGGVTLFQLGKEFNVHLSTISKITTNKNWAHV